MNLDTVLKQLRLSAMGQTLSVRSAKRPPLTGSPMPSFLELILHDELNVREQRRLTLRTKAADFRALKTLEDFDWRFNFPASLESEIYELAACHFIRKATDALFVWSARYRQNPSGPGHRLRGSQAGLPRALPFHLRPRGGLPQRGGPPAAGQNPAAVSQTRDLLIIDDMGLKLRRLPAFRRVPLRGHHAPLRNQIHHHDLQPARRRVGQTPAGRPHRRRYPRPVPSSRPILAITGKSYRLKDSALAKTKAATSTP